ncbi:carboxyl transferase domain-containing protein [Paraburkholderia sabiae]|uniref:Carboxyl transferase domain-containing protein n=1 Tax=Paraburkholderia sabiae TaxID=273251 RepID=A0ABU9QSJ7_9BURK|nr:carboxyl transferase domain-containing protein [Paraburkholderia sabiae]WJZ79457.1 carboxyl transferase domain-containing protein [Paraburkholderia sabiae]CAD6562762.1 Methylmalonyl-CoA carboxyltransferase 12S subunit [Paraburkholderia sabiae]
MQISLTRINALFDPNSFVDHNQDERSHFICGEGLINSVRTFLVMNRGRDCEFQGSGQWCTAKQIISTVTQARNNGAPLIYIQDQSGGTGNFDTSKVLSRDMSRLLLSPSGMGRVSASIAEFAETHLLISAILGPTSGPLALPLMLADLVLMTEKGALCMGRPDMVKAMLSQESDVYSLGGTNVHSKDSGSVQLVFDDEGGLFRCLKKLVNDIFNGRSRSAFEYQNPDPTDFEKLIPSDHRKPYDMHDLLYSFIDKGSLTEISALHAMEILTGYATIQGNLVAVIANNPRHNGGIIHRKSASKMVKMINIAAKTKTPIVFVADVPGFMIGKEAERSGIFSAAAELFRSHIQCKVPKLLLVARKAYTGGVYAMCGPGFDPVAVLAYPHAHIGVFSPDTMNKVLSSLDEDAMATARTLTKEIEDPKLLKISGLITDVIKIEQTRDEITKYLFPNR